MTSARTARAPTLWLKTPALRATITATTGIQGWFDVYLICKHSGRVKKHLSFPNLMLDVGLAELTAGTSLFGSSNTRLTRWCVVGTGNSTPAPGQTSLDNPVAATDFDANINEVRSSGEEFVWRETRTTRVFQEGQANGNLSEVGFRGGPTTETFITRQLMRDDNGDPTTITKTNQELLRVDYRGRVHAHIMTHQQNVALSIASGPWDPADFEFVAYTRGVEVSRDDHGSSFQRSWTLSRTSPLPGWSYNARVQNRVGLADWNQTTLNVSDFSQASSSEQGASGASPDHFSERIYMWDLGRGNIQNGINYIAWGGAGGPMFNTWLSNPIMKTEQFRLYLALRHQIQRVSW